MTSHRSLCAAVSILSSVACTSTEQVNIGNTGLLGAKLSDYAGDWQGYAEAYSWRDGTDTLQLTLAADGTGTLQVGTAVDAATLASMHPFPGANDDAQKPAPLAITPGFTYPVSDAKVETQRLRVSARSSDVYASWCEAQTPMLIQDRDNPPATPSYNCLGTLTTLWAPKEQNGQLVLDAQGNQVYGCFLGDDRSREVDCDTLPCLSVCKCTQQRCAPLDDAKSIQLDGALQEQGEALTGTLVVASDRVVVRLTRN